MGLQTTNVTMLETTRSWWRRGVGLAAVCALLIAGSGTAFGQFGGFGTPPGETPANPGVPPSSFGGGLAPPSPITPIGGLGGALQPPPVLTPAEIAAEITKLETEAKDHITKWGVATTGLITDTHANAVQALNQFYGLHTSAIESGRSWANAGTNLTWAGGAFAANPLGAGIGVGAVLTQCIVNAALDRATASGPAALRAATLQKMLDVRQKDRDRVVATLTKENADLATVVAQARSAGNPNLVRQHLQLLKMRLRIITKPPTVQSIFLQLVFQLVQAEGWYLRGSMWHLRNFGTYWSAPGQTDWPFWLDGTDIADELNRLGIKLGLRVSIGPPNGW